MISILKHFVLLTAIVVSCTSINAQWNNIGTDSILRVEGLSFPTPDIGYAFMDKNGGGPGYLYYSQNGGIDWTQMAMDSQFSNATFMDISFPTTTVGYVSIAKFTPGITNFIYKTFNGGRSWVDVTPPISRFIYDNINVDFVSEEVGYVNVSNVVYKTIDGGENWTSKTFTGILHGSIQDIDFADKDHGILGAWDGSFAYMGTIFFTNNGGSSWDSLAFDTVNTSITKVQQVTKSLAFALGGNSWVSGQGIYKTTDNGQTWDTLKLTFLTDSADSGNDFYFQDATTGYIITQNGYVYSTTDGGVNWKIDYKERFGLKQIESTGKSLLVTGNINVLLTNDLKLGLIEETISSNFSIYPNPVSVGSRVFFSEPINGTLNIYNSIGEKLSTIVGEKLESIDTENLDLKAGMYFLIIENNGFIQKLQVH